MKPHELVRAAAEIIKATDWSQGAAARDHNGEQVPLYQPATGGDSRVSIHPNAVAFSIYGALAKALATAGTKVANPGLMWQTLSMLAEGHVVPGGTNHVHSLIAFNDVEGRTKDEVLAFLEEAAQQLEPRASEPAPAIDYQFSEPLKQLPAS